MKIGIDARFYGPRVGGGGIGRYVAELVQHLQRVDSTHDYTLLLKRENFHECRITNSRFEKALVDAHWYGLREQFAVPSALKRSRIDFAHFPHWNIPLFSNLPFLVTIHDLILLEEKGSALTTTRSGLVHGVKYAAFRVALEKAIYKSRHIIAVSEATKESILRHFRVRSEKISVIPNGIRVHTPERQVTLRALGVSEPYFLYVGNAYPHKNVETLIAAFARIARRADSQLVIAGKRDAFSERLRRQAEELGIERWVKFLDSPDDDKVTTLYKSATLFVYPSRIEGFGMPPLEALAHGAPVAASNAKPMPEILGSLVHYFDPDDIEALEGLLHRALRNHEALKPKAEDVSAHLRHYEWDTVAEKTLAIYEHVARTL